MEIDDIDFSILKALNSSHRPLWKKQVHRLIVDDGQGVADVDEVSVQTVGRRIDRLHENSLLEPCIIHPENINRDLIIAYKPTEKGENVLEEKRDEILRECASCTVLGDPASPDYECDTLAELAQRELGVAEETADRILECDPDCLQAVISYHYSKEALLESVNEEAIDRLAEIAQDDEELEEAFTLTGMDPL